MGIHDRVRSVLRRSAPPRVLIIGAGFAGLSAAKNLPSHWDVTMADPGAWFEFLPNIHELVSGVKEPGALRLSRERVISRAGHRFVQQAVAKLDPRAGRAVLEGGEALDFDWCVAACGGENNTFGVAGADEHSNAFKSVDDCDRIGRLLDRTCTTGPRASIVIVGGGLEGVECLGEVLRRFGHCKHVALHLIEGRERLLADAPADIHADILRLCAPMAVHCHTRVTVKRVNADSVELSNGARLSSDCTIWTGGVKAPGLLHDWGLAEKAGDWAAAASTLQSPRHKKVFVAGDAGQTPLSITKQAYHALDMGKLAAVNIQRAQRGKGLLDFQPADKPTLVSFGDLCTYLIWKNQVLAGTILAGAKEAVYQLVMFQLDPAGPGGLSLHTAQRTLAAAKNTLFPMIASPENARRLAGVRLLD